ncbi:myotubularin-related protein 10-B [Aplysia californica]|uniref:Myotubularin-related protein 10-B n=1 Tax=Aplysia californica TaxID=6500 RepID=A0ABM0K5E3_APLCA|nr:myotubularin-related protein 10-B [Aplysia californica]
MDHPRASVFSAPASLRRLSASATASRMRESLSEMSASTRFQRIQRKFSIANFTERGLLTAQGSSMANDIGRVRELMFKRKLPVRSFTAIGQKREVLEDRLVEEEEEEEDASSLSVDKTENKEEVERVASAFFDNLLEPRKLQGEYIIAEADSILMFAPFSNRKQGISGHLFVTNFKISFVTADKSSYPDGDNNRSAQRNKLIDNTDIPLTNVDAIYQVATGARRKKLVPGSAVTTPTKHLEIHCKDFQTHVFGFKFTSKEQNRQVTNAVMVYSFPAKDDLLFAYEFGHKSQQEGEAPQPEFYERDHWERELERLQCQSMWRVADVNIGYSVSTSLPEYFVTPIKLLNTDLEKAAAQFTDNRIPTWSYTYVNGASLVRMSQIMQESAFKWCEEKILSAVRQSSGNDKELLILDLSRMCPSLLDVRTSVERLKSIIMTDSAKDFYSSDSRWFNNLENSQWLQQVSSCLNTANHVVNQLMRESQTVVLKEESGCDFTALISSLVQLQLDPEFRTISGFQSLLQREWVVMGHPFQRRLHLVWSQNVAETEQAPIFLLFLDCVWQLLQQFPSSFAFTETYLTSLWDSVHLGLFDTFLFNSCWHRKKFLIEGPNRTFISLPSAWDWTFHLSDEQILLFNNPLYTLRTSFDLDKVVHSARNTLRLSGEELRESRYSMLLGSPPPSTDMFALQETVLKPEVTASLIKLWAQCFLRWIVPAQIVGGGNPSQYMQQCILAEEVICLQHKLQQVSQLVQQQASERNPEQRDGNNSGHLQVRLRAPRPQSGLVFGATGYQSTSKQLSSLYITSSFPFSPGVSQHTQHTLICGPLSRYLKETEIDHDYNQDTDD